MTADINKTNLGGFYLQLVLIDSKILLNEWTYKKLLAFAKLSAIDNRLVVLPLVKMFLQVCRFFVDLSLGGVAVYIYIYILYLSFNLYYTCIIL